MLWKTLLLIPAVIGSVSLTPALAAGQSSITTALLTKTVTIETITTGDDFSRQFAQVLPRQSAQQPLSGGCASQPGGCVTTPRVQQRQNLNVIQGKQRVRQTAPIVEQAVQPNRRSKLRRDRNLGLGGVFLYFGPGIQNRYNDGFYYGDCAWLRRKARHTGSRYWIRRFQQCRYG